MLVWKQEDREKRRGGEGGQRTNLKVGKRKERRTGVDKRERVDK